MRRPQGRRRDPRGRPAGRRPVPRRPRASVRVEGNRLVVGRPDLDAHRRPPGRTGRGVRPRRGRADPRRRRGQGRRSASRARSRRSLGDRLDRRARHREARGRPALPAHRRDLRRAPRARRGLRPRAAGGSSSWLEDLTERDLVFTIGASGISSLLTLPARRHHARRGPSADLPDADREGRADGRPQPGPQPRRRGEGREGSRATCGRRGSSTCSRRRPATIDCVAGGRHFVHFYPRQQQLRRRARGAASLAGLGRGARDAFASYLTAGGSGRRDAEARRVRGDGRSGSSA